VNLHLKLKQYRDQLENKNQQLLKALEDVKQLSGIVPICAACKKIRNDSGYWQQVEQFVADHSDAKFSHGYCPDCYQKEMKKIEEYKRRKQQGEGSEGLGKY
jgi:hypothetical protein